ncbi:DUF2269 family protein [Bacillus sp. 03113]|uniref:DUF2269 family protein n=1 Tax=Bacillus sp. 03113 TaxID=2578211 RepID=UPI00215C04C3|nr:DUF2269 family protein [Bacillus sp. 03113]
MEWIVFIHVISAVIGFGPAYAFPFILKKEKSIVEVQRTTELVSRLEVFPKIFGTLTLLSGLLLLWLGEYGSIISIWIGGTLVLYLIAEVVIVGFLAPAAKRLSSHLAQLIDSGEILVNEESLVLLQKVRNLHIVACAIVLIIFIFMVIKPV